MKMNKKGVTLLELIVVFVIIAIGAVLMVPNLSPWIANYRLRGDTRDIASTLRTAQMKAVSNNMDYRVFFDTGARTYALQRNSGGVWVDEGNTQTLSTGITMSTTFGSPLQFRPNSSSTGGTVTLQNTRGTTRTITVLLSTGRITVQ